MSSLKPLNDYVIIRKLEHEKQSSGGLLIPEGIQDDTNKGEVTAVGPGLPSFADANIVCPMTVKVGDIVIVPRFTHKLEVNGEELYIVKENEIYAILEN